MNVILDRQDVVWKPRRLQFLVKRMKGLLALASALFLVLLVGFGVWLGVLRSSYFALKQIEIVGDLRELSMQQVFEATNISLGKNLFRVSLKRVEQNILRLPWVASVSIRRQAPDTIWIHVREQKAKALLLVDKLYFVSAGGHVFKEVEQEKGRDLPVLTGFGTEGPLTKALELIDFFEEKHDFGVFGISEIHYNGSTGFSIVTLKGPMEIRLGRENFEAKLTRLKTIWSHLEPRLGRVRGIDLDYSDKAFVKL